MSRRSPRTNGQRNAPLVRMTVADLAEGEEDDVCDFDPPGSNSQKTHPARPSSRRRRSQEGKRKSPWKRQRVEKVKKSSRRRQERRSNSETSRRKWSKTEDDLLLSLYPEDGSNANWTKIADSVPFRTNKQCRERYNDHLDPTLDKSPFTAEEDAIILEWQRTTAQRNHWTDLKEALPPGRNANRIKNHWNSTLKKRAEAAGDLGRVVAPRRKNSRPRREEGREDDGGSRGGGRVSGGGGGGGLESHPSSIRPTRVLTRSMAKKKMSANLKTASGSSVGSEIPIPVPVPVPIAPAPPKMDGVSFAPSPAPVTGAGGRGFGLGFGGLISLIEFPFGISDSPLPYPCGIPAPLPYPLGLDFGNGLAIATAPIAAAHLPSPLDDVATSGVGSKRARAAESSKSSPAVLPPEPPMKKRRLSGGGESNAELFGFFGDDDASVNGSEGGPESGSFNPFALVFSVPSPISREQDGVLLTPSRLALRDGRAPRVSPDRFDTFPYPRLYDDRPQPPFGL